MAINLAPEIHTQSTGETVNHAVDMAGLLDSSELFTGTPTIIEYPTPSPQLLTISNKAVNSTVITINGRSCAAGEAITCSIACATAGTYHVLITCGTTSTPAQTRSATIKLIVTAP